MRRVPYTAPAPLMCILTGAQQADDRGEPMEVTRGRAVGALLSHPLFGGAVEAARESLAIADLDWTSKRAVKLTERQWAMLAAAASDIAPLGLSADFVRAALAHFDAVTRAERVGKR